MNSSLVRKEMEDYQEIVRVLSSSVSDVAVDWQDEVYSGLHSQISLVAFASRQVMESGINLCESLSVFERILNEG